MKIAITCPLFISTINHKDMLDKSTMSFKTKHDYIYIPVFNYIAPELKPLYYQFTQQPLYISDVEGPQPQCVAKGWNAGVKRAIKEKCDYILIINDDVIFRKDSIDNLLEFASLNAGDPCISCEGKGYFIKEWIPGNFGEMEGVKENCSNCSGTGKIPDNIILWSMGSTTDLFGFESMELDKNYSEHPNFSAYMIKPDFFDKVGYFDEKFGPAYYEDNDMHARIVLQGYKAMIYGGARFFHFGSGTLAGDSEYKQKVTPFETTTQQRFLNKFGHLPVGEVEEMKKVYYSHPFDNDEMTWKDW